eukprot:6758684-Alexandrium_andersonii.AAC.1
MPPRPTHARPRPSPGSAARGPEERGPCAGMPEAPGLGLCRPRTMLPAPPRRGPEQSWRRASRRHCDWPLGPTA